jgi:branched-chain amino acid transport system ATP-binding protein
MTAVLEIESLSVRYGGVRALSDATLSVAPRQLVGLIGPNGAGKTTLTDAVTGFAAATGAVRLRGEDVSALAPHQRAHRGLARTWQAGDLFEELTVRENLEVAAARPSLRDSLCQLLKAERPVQPIVDELLELLDLRSLADSQPSSLTEGQRKLVGVARALAAKPDVICLDEPAAGLDSRESEALGRHLRRVADRGTGMLLIDHDTGLVLGICDQVVVLDFGRVIATGTPDEVRRNRQVVEAYLGAASGEVTELLDV